MCASTKKNRKSIFNIIYEIISDIYFVGKKMTSYQCLLEIKIIYVSRNDSFSITLLFLLILARD